MASNSKQYGLIKPKKANQGVMRPRPSVFDDNSDSEEDGSGGGGATDWVRKALKRESEKGFQRKQTRLDVQKAIEEDPTVYQYDEIYEKIEEKKSELLNTKQKQNKKPRYIQSLLLQAEKRKREQERRNERIIQKEREAEGDQFKDKESFVTSAYREKLEEFKTAEEEERRQDVIEALTDVSKQKDLSGFYRHLYRVTTEEPGAVKVKEEKEDTTQEQEASQAKGDSQKVDEPSVNVEKEMNKKRSGDSRDVVSEKAAIHESAGEVKSSNRHYRKRRASSASSNSESGHSINKENPDADSDFSVDSDSSDSESDSSKSRSKSKKERKTDKPKVDTKDGESNDKAVAEKRKTVEEKEVKCKKVKEGGPQENGEKQTEKELDSEVKSVEKMKKEPKINIWEKRTVGEMFDNALQRYYQRKAAKLANRG